MKLLWYSVTLVCALILVEDMSSAVSVPRTSLSNNLQLRKTLLSQGGPLSHSLSSWSRIHSNSGISISTLLRQDGTCSDPPKEQIKCFTDCAKGSCPDGCCAGKLSLSQVLACTTGSCCVRVIVYKDGVAFITEKKSAGSVEGGVCSSLTDCSSSPCQIFVDSNEKIVSCPSYQAPGASEDTSGDSMCPNDSSGSNDNFSESDENSSESDENSSETSKAPTTSGASSGGTGSSSTPKGDAGAGNPNVPTKSEKGGCFPLLATVKLESGAEKRMHDLQIGDRVQVGPSKYSTVFMFTHKILHVSSEFHQFRLHSGHVMSATAGHYLYSSEGLVAAENVQVGHRLMLGDGRSSTVADKTIVMLQGLYNPQTVHGDIVVDGVLTSTYTTAVNPKLAHIWLAPLRTLWNWCGVYTSLFNSGADKILNYMPMIKFEL